MARTTGPLMSIAASGSYAKTLVFASWKGRSYVRERVIPLNPKTSKQTGVRAMMSFLAKQWATLIAGEKANYVVAAAQKSISPFNEFLSCNLAAWKNSDPPSKNWPAEKSSTALTIVTQTLTGGKGMVTISLTPSGSTAIWGMMIFRDTATITACTWANCVAVIAANGSNAVTHVDTPLNAGTYHYRTLVFNDDCKQGAAYTDATATVT